MNVVHPITEVLQEQLNRRHFTPTAGDFNEDFGYELTTRETQNAGYHPQLTISTVTPYRKEPDRHDRHIWTEAELVRHHHNHDFLPVRRTVSVLAGLLGPGSCKTHYDWKKANLPPHELENIQDKKIQERLGRPFPGLINDHNDQYNVAHHYIDGALEERLPWFRCGVLTYTAQDSGLIFKIDDPQSYLGAVRVTFNLHPVPDLHRINAVAWYLENLPRR